MPAERVTSFSPWHIILVLDDSDGVSGNVAQEINAVILDLLAEMETASKGSKPYFRVSAIALGDTPVVIETFQDVREVEPDRLASVSGGAGQANLASALDEATAILTSHPGNKADFRPYVFIFAGSKDFGERSLLARSAAKLKRLKIDAGAPKIVAFAFGDADLENLSLLASTPQLAKRPGELSNFLSAFAPIGTYAGYSLKGEQQIDDIIMNL